MTHKELQGEVVTVKVTIIRNGLCDDDWVWFDEDLYHTEGVQDVLPKNLRFSHSINSRHLHPRQGVSKSHNVDTARATKVAGDLEGGIMHELVGT